MQTLIDMYGGQAYYDAPIGNTLGGHRSNGGGTARVPDREMTLRRSRARLARFYVLLRTTIPSRPVVPILLLAPSRSLMPAGPCLHPTCTLWPQPER
jgi:hypothetical protein